MPQHSANLRLIGYEKFTISAVFLRALEDEIRVSQWGPKRNPKIAVHRCLGIRTGNQLRTEIEQPCSVSLISGHVGQDGNGTLWIGKDSKGKVRLNLQILGQIGAASVRSWLRHRASTTIGVRLRPPRRRSQDVVVVAR